MDEELDIYWCNAADRGEYAYTWADFNNFLRGGFGLPLKDRKQSSGVGHSLKEVNKCLAEVK